MAHQYFGFKTIKPSITAFDCDRGQFKFTVRIKFGNCYNFAKSLPKKAISTG